MLRREAIRKVQGLENLSDILTKHFLGAALDKHLEAMFCFIRSVRHVLSPSLSALELFAGVVRDLRIYFGSKLSLLSGGDVPNSRKQPELREVSSTSPPARRR